MRRTYSVRALTILALIYSLVGSVPSAGIAQEGAAVPVAAKPRTLEEVRDRITGLIDQPKFAASRFGVLILNERGEVIFERDAGKAFTPASNMKLYTTSAALDAFGLDFRIETSVYASKPIKRGVLHGDLIFYGRGDPNLSARFEGTKDLSTFQPADAIPAIESLADQIKSRGIRRVIGDVIGDDSYFATDLLGTGWEWDDVQFYYGAEVSALTVNDNVVTFTIRPAPKVGGSPTITVQPKTSYVTIVNHATTSSEGTRRIGIHRPLEGNAVEFFGTIPRGAEKYEVQVAVHDPSRFAATLLKEALARRGIRFAGRIRRRDATDAASRPVDFSKLEMIAKVESPPLSTMLKVINKPSQNLHTELMLRQLGVTSDRALNDYGRPRATDMIGDEVRRRFLERAGVGVQPLSLRDGSGLARQDLVTPRSTVQLLNFMKTHRYFQVFRESLPVAGQDGTLERRMRDSAAAGNVRAKTGTLSYVSALSGYLQTRTGQLLVFSMMANNYVGPGRDVTQVFDQICVMLAEYEGQF